MAFDDPTYTVTYNYDDPSNSQKFNAEGRFFPELIYAQTGFKIIHFAKNWNNFEDQTVEDFDLTGTTSAKLYVKPSNNPLTPIELCDYDVVGSNLATGEIHFIVPSDTLSNSLAQYFDPGNPLPIVLYWIIENSSTNKKISLETDIRIMDINRDGNQESTAITAGDITYTPEQASKWTGQYWSQPTGVAEALDKLARLNKTDRGIILSQLASQPGSPTDADAHLATATAGDWTINYLYEWNSIAGVWLEHVPREGDEVYDQNTNDRLRWNGSAWTGITSGDVVGPASATNENIVVFDLATGKLVKDSGVNISAVTANTAKVTNATHTGQVTGATTLTLDKTAISDQTLVTVVGTDHILIGDASDSDTLKKALVSDLLSGAGNFPPSTDTTDKTSAYTVVAGDINQTVPVGSGTTADFDVTLDVSLFSSSDEVLMIVNESSYIARVVVSNTGTMTINSQYTDRYVSAGQTVTFSGDTSTNCRMIAGA